MYVMISKYRSSLSIRSCFSNISITSLCYYSLFSNVELEFNAIGKVNATKLLKSLDDDDVVLDGPCVVKKGIIYVSGRFKIRMPILTANRLFGNDRQVQHFHAQNVTLINNNRPASNASVGVRDSASSNDPASSENLRYKRDRKQNLLKKCLLKNAFAISAMKINSKP